MLNLRGFPSRESYQLHIKAVLSLKKLHRFALFMTLAITVWSVAKPVTALAGIHRKEKSQKGSGEKISSYAGNL
jgi:hypothetical protein